MLALFEIELETLNKGEIPPTHGHMVHGLFFKILKQTEPELCQSLHDMNGTMPYTLSTLYKHGTRPGDLTIEIEKGKRMCLRVGLCNDNLVSSVSMAMNKAMITGPVAIAGVPMKIMAIRLLQTEDIEDIEQGNSLNAGNWRVFRIDFQTLTSFRSEGRSLLFPESRLFISSLYRSWEAAGGKVIQKETLRNLVESIYAVRYDMHTGILDMGNYFISGFTGYCMYEIDKSLNQEDRALLKNILKIVPYVGIGYKTTM